MAGLKAKKKSRTARKKSQTTSKKSPSQEMSKESQEMSKESKKESAAQLLQALKDSLQHSQLGDLQEDMEKPEYGDIMDLAVSIKQLWPDDLAEYAESMLASMLVADRYYQSYAPPNLPPTADSDSPKKPMKLVILSESHSRTDSPIIGRDILPEYHHLVPEKYRLGHLNLVHCLSYGEPWLAGIKDPGCARGTPRFWMILSILSGEQDEKLQANSKPSIFAHLKGSSSPEDRVRAKVQILENLERRGIALIDVSPAPIFLAAGTIKAISKKTGKQYNTPAAKLPGGTQQKIISLCFDQYIKNMLLRLGAQNVVVLGKCVTERIGQSNLEGFCANISAKFHGTLQHPSARNSQAFVKYLPHMLTLKELTTSCLSEQTNGGTYSLEPKKATGTKRDKEAEQLTVSPPGKRRRSGKK